MNPKLVTLLTRIAETLDRIERLNAPAAPESLPLLEAIARTYGTAQAVEVAAQVEIARAEAETTENGTAKKTRTKGPNWSAEYPHLRTLLQTMREQTAKAKRYHIRLQTETDETARLFFSQEIKQADAAAGRAHREYRAFIKNQIEASPN